MSIGIDQNVCNGCALCKSSCPFGAIEVKEGIAKILVGCTLCGACEKICPQKAIQIERKKIKRDEFSAYRGVWVFIEEHKSEIKPVSFEILSEGRKLADEINQELVAVLVGHNVHHLMNKITPYGVDNVYLTEHKNLEQYCTETYTSILSGMISKYQPAIMLFGATYVGRDLAPRVAARLRTGLTADCTQLNLDEKGNLLQVRPTFGGNIMASIICPYHRPQMATVRPHVMKRRKVNNSKRVRVERISVKLNPKSILTRIVEEIEEIRDFPSVEEADIVVAGGRGVGSGENFTVIKKLARLLGGTVGASRTAVDEGWRPHQQQIGQTGKTVSPKLYIACGISGAIQHLIGMRTSARIIAINKDRNAPIMKIADVGIVGDLFEILPPLTKSLQEKLRKAEDNSDFGGKRSTSAGMRLNKRGGE